ncbi:MAG: hypothetical protein ACTSUE_23875 [Promethearchaeota archaeon]
MHEKLVDDLIAIVTSFSGRVHGMHRRRRRTKQGNGVAPGTRRWTLPLRRAPAGK